MGLLAQLYMLLLILLLLDMVLHLDTELVLDMAPFLDMVLVLDMVLFLDMELALDMAQFLDTELALAMVLLILDKHRSLLILRFYLFSVLFNLISIKYQRLKYKRTKII